MDSLKRNRACVQHSKNIFAAHSYRTSPSDFIPLSVNWCGAKIDIGDGRTPQWYGKLDQ